jgi:membrane-associated phospholipid phosphatase
LKKLKAFYKKYPQCWVLLYLAVYVPWFILLERHVTADYTIIQTGLDEKIPFCECFILPYCAWYLYFAGTAFYFLLKRPKEEFYEFAAMIASGMTFWLVLCTLWPNGLNLRPQIDPGKNFCTWLLSLIYAADTPTNVFPSMHVYVSVVIHGTIARYLGREHPWVSRFSFILMVLICLSTMFIKQHSAADVIGGVGLYALLALLIYRKRKPEQEKS